MITSRKEKEYVRTFCSKIGKIVTMENPDRVENTVCAELRKFFGGYALSGKGKLIVGKTSDCKDIAKLCEEGKLTIGDVSELDDGFEIKQIGDDVVVAGANSRAVLYGVYELEDRIVANDFDSLDIKIVPHFRKRSDALGHYHNPGTYNSGNDVVDDKKAEFLARLRINQFCACFDGSPFGNSICDFVHSDVFPFQREPSKEAVSTLKNLSYTLSKYGIDFHMMTWEPSMPWLFAPVEKYPAEALGRVRRPWGGDENNLDTTLCLNSPLVQEHYRNVIGKFVREYPDVKGFFLYNMDGGSWLCTPELCPRCAEHLVDSDPSIHNPWETQALLATLVSDAAHAVDPDFKINFWGAVHFCGDAVTKMLDTAKGYDHVAVACMGSDHDIFVTNTEEPVFEVAATLAAGKKYNAPSYIYYAYNKLEAIQNGFPSPFAAAEAIKTFKRWGAANLMEVTGPTPALNQITAITMRKFQSEPDTDTESFLTDLANRQFGSEAGKKMYEAWQENQKAFECWRNFSANPLCGSQFTVRMGLLSTTDGKPSILPPVLDSYDGDYTVLTNVEPFRAKAYAQTRSPEFLERFRNMEPHLAKSEQLAKEAIDLAGDDPIGICYYNGAFEGIARHTQKEYAILNHAPIEMALSLCRQNIDMVYAVQLLRSMRDNPETKAELLPKYLELLKHDQVVLRDYSEMLERFLKLRPSLALCGMCENEMEKYLESAQLRISMIDDFLKNPTL